jgi:hypothetical protein
LPKNDRSIACGGWGSTEGECFGAVSVSGKIGHNAFEGITY